MELQTKLKNFTHARQRNSATNTFSAFDEFKAALNEGRVRAAEPDASSPSGWRVNGWVKKGILLGFRLGRIVEMRDRRA